MDCRIVRYSILLRLAEVALKYQKEQHLFRAKPLFALGLKEFTYSQWI